VLEIKVEDHYGEFDYRILGVVEKVEDTQASIESWETKVRALTAEFRETQKEFKESQELLAVNIKKMAKDKRQLTEKLIKNFQLLANNEGQVDLLKGFLVRIATLVNLLRKAEAIDICLYS